MYLLIMELRFDAILYSNLGNEISDADRRFPSCGLRRFIDIFAQTFRNMLKNALFH